MSIHYTLVFVLLCVEMVTFLLLSLPLPMNFRRKLTNWITKSPLMARLQHFARIAFVFVAVLFLDSLNSALKGAHTDRHSDKTGAVQYDLQVYIKMFRAQRNLYLCGSTLFLAFVLQRSVSMISRIAELEEQAVKSNASYGNHTDSIQLETLHRQSDKKKV